MSDMHPLLSVQTGKQQQLDLENVINAKDSSICTISNQLNIAKIEIETLNEILINNTLKLEDYRYRHSNLYNSMPFGYFCLNQKGYILEINDAAGDLLGLKKSQLKNKNLARYIAPNFQHIFHVHCKKTIINNKLETEEVKVLRKNGPIFHAQFDSKPILNFLTGEKNIITFVSDISHRKQKEEHLFQQHHRIATTERNTSMIELASVISHELNHPLSVIGNYINGCIRRIESERFDAKEIISALNKAADQSFRISEIILRMKNFTCHGTIQCETTDINSLIADVISLIKYESSSNAIKIKYQPRNNLPLISIDKVHIEQVVLNLARNAVEALIDEKISNPKLTIEVNQANTREIEICVIDNGPGITSDNYHKLFNPYFTTKHYGVGLGLAVCRTIIHAHNGKITAGENPFGGACFKITLPINMLN